MARRSPHYPGSIRYLSITIPNTERNHMREVLNSLPFVAYHVETIEDGRKICITKPGGKQFWGTLQPNDYMVWIYDEERQDRWRISHSEIYEDIKTKLAANPTLASVFVDKLHEVCNGAEPNDMQLDSLRGQFATLPGFPAELVLKTYKWIWGQEDCNYPNGKGRRLSMDPILELRQEMT
jgi:hypothetical protein